MQLKPKKPESHNHDTRRPKLQLNFFEKYEKV